MREPREEFHPDPRIQTIVLLKARVPENEKALWQKNRMRSDAAYRDNQRLSWRE